MTPTGPSSSPTVVRMKSLRPAKPMRSGWPSLSEAGAKQAAGAEAEQGLGGLVRDQSRRALAGRQVDVLGCSQATTQPRTCGSKEPTTNAPPANRATPKTTQLVRSVAT